MLVDHSHPYIHVDMSRCINCYRCVRICDEVQGQCRLAPLAPGRSDTKFALTVRALLESRASVCGACVDTCPSGALEDHEPRGTRHPDRLDADDLPLLRHGLRAGGRHARRTHRRRPPGRRGAGQQGPPVREGPLRHGIRDGDRPRDGADDPARRNVADARPGTKPSGSSADRLAPASRSTRAADASASWARPGPRTRTTT